MPYHKSKKKDDKPKMVIVVMKKKDAKMKPKKEHLIERYIFLFSQLFSFF